VGCSISDSLLFVGIDSISLLRTHLGKTPNRLRYDARQITPWCKNIERTF
jgi:hypothetical protein